MVCCPANGNAEEYFLTDAQGSTVALTDSSGAILQEYHYGPYGEANANAAGITNPFQYTGRENDGDGLYYYRARYYSPALKRFISEDPIGFNGGQNNFYAYVDGNPVGYVDPLGLSSAIYDNATHTLTIFDNDGNIVGSYPAYNNTTSTSRGPWAPGTYTYDQYVSHQGGPDSPYGSNGAFEFNVPGCIGCEIHSGRQNIPDGRGRRGPQHATNGCIRTTDAGTKKLLDLQNSGDPLTVLQVN